MQRRKWLAVGGGRGDVEVGASVTTCKRSANDRPSLKEAKVVEEEGLEGRGRLMLVIDLRSGERLLCSFCSFMSVRGGFLGHDHPS